MLKKTVVLIAPIVMVAALALLPIAGASGDLVCPKGQTNKSYCTKQCVVPKMVGRGLKKAKQLLAAHDCKVGKVKRKEVGKDKKGNKKKDKHEKKGKEGGRVKKQSQKPGTVLPAGTKIDLNVIR